MKYFLSLYSNVRILGEAASPEEFGKIKDGKRKSRYNE